MLRNLDISVGKFLGVFALWGVVINGRRQAVYSSIITHRPHVGLHIAQHGIGRL